MCDLCRFLLLFLYLHKVQHDQSYQHVEPSRYYHRYLPLIPQVVNQDTSQTETDHASEITRRRPYA